MPRLLLSFAVKKAPDGTRGASGKLLIRLDFRIKVWEEVQIIFRVLIL